MPESQEISTNNLQTDTSAARPATERKKTLTPPLFKVNDDFNVDKAPDAEADSIIERQLSPYEKAYTYKDRSYIIWTEGPKAGKIHRIVAEPTDEQVARLPKMDEIQKRIVQVLADSESIELEFEELAKVNSDEKYAVRKTVNQKRIDLYVYLHKLYYGDEQTVGLEQAQLFALEGEGQKYYDFISEIVPRDDNPQNMATKGKGYKKYLQTVAIDHGFSHSANRLNSLGPEVGEMETLAQYYYGIDKEYKRFHDPDSPVILLHMTFGNALPNIVQMEGLAAKNYFESHGIKKRFGGESGGPSSYTADDVSFWYYPDGNVPLVGGHGSAKGFEYPMAIGIDRTRGGNLTVDYGTMHNEITVENFVSFHDISHIFVPAFKVAEVQADLAAQGFEHIKVIPFNTSVSEPGEITTEEAPTGTLTSRINELGDTFKGMRGGVMGPFDVVLPAFLRFIKRRYKERYGEELPQTIETLDSVRRLHEANRQSQVE